MATLGKDTGAAIDTLARLNVTVDGQMKQGHETSESMESLILHQGNPGNVLDGPV